MADKNIFGTIGQLLNFFCKLGISFHLFFFCFLDLRGKLSLIYIMILSTLKTKIETLILPHHQCWEAEFQLKWTIIKPQELDLDLWPRYVSKSKVSINSKIIQKIDFCSLTFAQNPQVLIQPTEQLQRKAFYGYNKIKCSAHGRKDM